MASASLLKKPATKYTGMATQESFDNALMNETQTVNQFTFWFYNYIHGQTSLASLMLYAYLFWWIFIMAAFGASNMPSVGWENGTLYSIKLYNKIKIDFIQIV